MGASAARPAVGDYVALSADPARRGRARGADVKGGRWSCTVQWDGAGAIERVGTFEARWYPAAQLMVLVRRTDELGLTRAARSHAPRPGRPDPPTLAQRAAAVQEGLFEIPGAAPRPEDAASSPAAPTCCADSLSPS